ncbi:hypothetical protein D3C75_943350 [compost metagenome]
MAVLLLDVLAHCAAQPLQPRWQTGPAGHHQGYGVPHVVVSLGQKGHIGLEAGLAGQRVADDRDAEQCRTLVGGFLLQRIEEKHGKPRGSLKVG